jgi:hypothetical protein
MRPLTLTEKRGDVRNTTGHDQCCLAVPMCGSVKTALSCSKMAGYSAEKLIALVEEKRSIYVLLQKEHSNRGIQGNLRRKF